jgi:hypothetical protein
MLATPTSVVRQCLHRFAGGIAFGNFPPLADTEGWGAAELFTLLASLSVAGLCPGRALGVIWKKGPALCCHKRTQV